MEVALPNTAAHLKSLDPVRLSMDHLVDRKTDASVPKPNPSPKPNLNLTHILNLKHTKPIGGVFKENNRYTPTLPLSCLSGPGGGAGERDNARHGREAVLPAPVAHLLVLSILLCFPWTTGWIGRQMLVWCERYIG